jgi:hypothetical protein
MPTIKVSRKIYDRLNEMVEELSIRFHRPFSLDEVLDSAMKARSMRPSDFAGTVVMTDREMHENSRD